ncbi:hypothetical protein PF005_g8334 [Phytophthora fragariae]|uniref:Prephenate dehydratase domain-containing protein n=2 Tax=Phytophthora TaxID=4783 RepID=A0A6A3ZPH1_9STRA|nr:hypothetical protein PF011_g19711 [Phytophthora fragariae]KAE9039170.1 hypothetical protein PR002_g5638 [Phytophthora rubi]KAE9041929.1 hypothetical protein PR001_g6414 [Phytophthora rubi]KAE9218271.1 hypothetical protein PF005_g8334 [Phytophthora fragariae]KAE9230066.1 hypothetical protein PF004_g10586 [Phytophthora fragariae]
MLAALPVAYKRAEAACTAVKGEEANFSVLSIESSTLGSIRTNDDLLLKYRLYILGE